MDPFLPDDAKLDAIRELLPSLASGIRLDVTAAGPFPAETDRALLQLAELELRLGRGGPARADELAQRADEAVAVVAAVLATTPDRVVLAAGPASALSAILVATTSLAIEPDAALAGGLSAVVASVARSHGLHAAPGAPAAGPRLVVAPQVDARTGGVLDVSARADEVHATGGALVVDMGWSAGAIAVDAPSSGADLVMVEMHRWLLGPEGVTAIWAGDPATADRLRALVDVPPPAQLLGVARSVGWLLMYVGLPWAFERVGRLALRLRDGLAAVGGVTMGDARGTIAATLPFRVEGWTVDEAAAELVRLAHAHVEADGARGVLLASVGAWTREAEVDRFVGAVAEIAAHTPGTLPRRPLLTVLAPSPWAER
ncbi:MAG: aminotransferase class V-fold PLP-dependent enzyme [Chloroflexota bacterium]